MNWDRVNVWTNTLYTLIHSLSLSKKIGFGNLSLVGESIADAGGWVSPGCSYDSVLLSKALGKAKVTFRRDPNAHFGEISHQIIKMLLQDLVVIFDEMMAENITAHGGSPANYPQSKVSQLRQFLSPKYDWAWQGCLELVAVRNVLTHSDGVWNERSIKIVSPFLAVAPNEGDKLIVGFPMLFRFRKAMRTLLNETKKK